TSLDYDPLKISLFPYTTLFRTSKLSDYSRIQQSDDGKILLIKTTYHDNAWITGRGDIPRDQNLIDEYESLKEVDFNWYNVNVLGDRKSTRLNSSHVKISYAVFC